MAGFPLYSNNSMPSWYDASEDVVMNDGNDFSFLAAQPIKAQQSQAPGGYPMEVSSSNGSASSAYSNSTTATTVSFMSSHTNHHLPVDEQHNVSFPTSFGNLSIEDPSYCNPFASLQSQAYDQPAYDTPSSLGWNEHTRVAEFYDLVLEKSPKAHYLVLKTHSGDPPKPDIFYMPHIVYLENDGQVLSDKKHHPCLYPGRGCWKDHNRRSFARAADLERHYNVVHHASVEEIKCDYPRCARHTDAFTRKDHCRDHYKEFHKEDIGSYKGAKNNIDKAQWQAKQQQWADERQIKPEWWRCPRCLDRIYVATEGWHCKSCNRDCENHRYEARIKLLEEDQGSYDDEEKMPTSSARAQTSIANCHLCQGWGYTVDLHGGSHTCYGCQSLGGSSTSHYNNTSSTQPQYDSRY